MKLYKNRGCFGAQALLLILFIYLFHPVGAQVKMNYDSSYQPILGHSGHANFTYVLDKNKEIRKAGSFSFQSKQRDSLDPSLFIYENWNGNYVDDKKQGVWVYKKTRQLVQLEDVEKWDVKYQLKTEVREIKANYTFGNPDKEWELKRNVYVNKEPVSETEYFRSQLKQQRLNGRIEFFLQPDSLRSCRVVGYAKNGLMDSSWVFEIRKKDSTILEYRQYKKGFLLSLTRIYESDTILHLNYPLSQLIQTALNSQSDEDQTVNHPVSLSFSDGYPRTSAYILAQQTGNQYLEALIKRLSQYDPAWIPEHGLPLGTNRGFYVMNQKEKSLLEKWPELEYSFREKVKKIKTSLDTTLLSNDTAAIAEIQKWAERQEYLLNYIKPWNNILTRKEIEFYYRKGELVSYAKSLLENDELQMNNGSYKKLHYTVPDENSQDFLQYISSNFERRKMVADSIQHVLNKYQQDLYVSQERQRINQQILKTKQLTEQLINDSKVHETIQPLMRHLNSYFLEQEFPRLYDSYLTRLQELQTPGKKAADSLIYLLESLQMIQEISSTLPDRARTIDSLYTIYTFDPFTFNDKFPRRIKKKLYDLIAVDLYNELLNEITSKTSVSEIKTGIRRIYDVQERLLFLHDKDTRKLERKLRKGSSMEAKMEAIKV